jgi:hypothetical protein
MYISIFNALILYTGATKGDKKEGEKTHHSFTASLTLRTIDMLFQMLI